MLQQKRYRARRQLLTSSANVRYDNIIDIILFMIDKLGGTMQYLTKKQKQILDFVQTYIDNNGYAPSYREIGDNFNLSSVATVAEHINTLRTKGYLENSDFGAARSLQINPVYADNYYEISLMGYIVAGKPIEAIRTEETIEIPKDMASKGVFALRVRGDSMINDGILDGDYVIIEPCLRPRNGEIVVALLDNENATLKRFYREKDHIRLQPANAKYEPIRTKRVVVQGRVKGVIRKF